MTGVEVATELAKPYKLTKAEQAMLAFTIDYQESNTEERAAALDVLCAGLGTTAGKLLSRVKPSLDRKMGQSLRQVIKGQGR